MNKKNELIYISRAVIPSSKNGKIRDKTFFKQVCIYAFNQLELKKAVSRQPVSVAIEADQDVFQFYKKGILDSKACGTSLDHGVLVVLKRTHSAASY